MKKLSIRPVHPAQGVTQCAALESDSRYVYPGMLFIYRDKLDSQRLQQSLARVLNEFSLYAGRFEKTQSGLHIHHGEGPATFEHHHVDESVDEWIAAASSGKTAQLEPRLSSLRVLFVREVGLSVRLTEGRDGCALAVGWNHTIGDTHSTMLLMRAWSRAYVGAPYESPKIVLDRDAYLRSVMPDPRESNATATRTSVLRGIGLRLLCLKAATPISLEYSYQELAALRRSLDPSERISINDTMCAHVYRALRELGGVTKTTNLCLVVNFRKRVGLSSQLIGNMTSVLDKPVSEGDSQLQIAADLRQRLEAYSKKHANYHATMRMFEAYPSSLDRLRLVSSQFTPTTGDFVVTNWSNFGTYDLAFGTAKPLLFRPLMLGLAKLPQWCSIVYDLPASRGLAMTIGLPPAVAKRCLSAEGRAVLYRFPRPVERRQAHPSPLRKPAHC